MRAPVKETLPSVMHFFVIPARAAAPPPPHPAGGGADAAPIARAGVRVEIREPAPGARARTIEIQYAFGVVERTAVDGSLTAREGGRRSAALGNRWPDTHGIARRFATALAGIRALVRRFLVR